MAQDTRILQTSNGTFFSSLPPAAAAFARGLTFAVATAAIGFGLTFFEGISAGSLAPYAPIAVVVFRTLEGLIDKAAVSS